MRPDMQVDSLTLSGKLAALNKTRLRDLRMNVQLCSATLTTLCLGGVVLDQFSSKLRRSAGAACSTLKVLAVLLRWLTCLGPMSAT